MPWLTLTLGTDPLEHYLHLADTGLVLADLSLRLYDTNGDSVSSVGVTMEELDVAGVYALDGVPDVATQVSSPYRGLTLTFEQPIGVYHARRIGVADSQPSSVIIPIREVLANPVADLVIQIFRDGVSSLSPIVTQLALDGEYLVTGWDSPSLLGEQWSVRWEYDGQVYSVQWTGNSLYGGDQSPTSYYLIEALQRPFLLSQLDAENRSIYSVNFEGYSIGATRTFEDEVAVLIHDEGIATILTNLFIGLEWALPNGDGPYVRVLSTGGPSGSQSHDGTRYERPRVQVLVHARSEIIARNTIHSIYNLLDKARDVQLSA